MARVEKMQLENIQLPQAERVKEKNFKELKNPKPTESPVFHTLTAGYAAAAAASLTFHLAAGTWGIDSLLKSSRYELVALLGLHAAYKAYVTLKSLVKIKDSNPGTNPLEHLENERISMTLETLKDKSSCRMPNLVMTEGGRIGMADNLYKRGTILADANFTSNFDNRELRGVIAHEISHAARSNTLFETALSPLRVFSFFAPPAAILVSGLMSLDGLSLLQGASAIVQTTVVAGVATIGTVLFSSALESLASKIQELRTDIRAVEISGDIMGYRSILKKITRPVNMLSHETPRLLACHPRPGTRFRWLLRACGFGRGVGGSEVINPQRAEGAKHYRETAPLLSETR